ncbi:Acidic phosphoprotein precursor PCEMA1, putative [Plasmodium chabaudi adami]|uniref:Acidic phosphoprotein PCEMA1, putative n=1 Tax=Plasmodium chabaudi adami TaxID=5826 RepID=A0A1D3LB18_PLACE|nr:Acidic phosphoprotein precursor PCEMA1, putative [Plasmodium chabaudi adami]
MSILINDSSEEIYEKNKDRLCTNPEETINAGNLMKEAAIHLIHHSKSNYKCVGESSKYNAFFYKKKHKDNTDFVKVTYRKKDPNKYNKIVGKLWDPDIINLIDYRFTKKKIARVYNPNLVIIQQRFKKWPWSPKKYFHALATKIQISEDKTIIAMTSANINDGYPSDKEYKNTLIESANLFTTEIDSEEDIRKGKLKKTFVNIAGYLIEKKDKYVDVTFIASIDGHTFI